MTELPEAMLKALDESRGQPLRLGQGHHQGDHNGGVDAEFQQGVVEVGGRALAGQGQLRADGEDVPYSRDDADDEEGLEL